MFTTGVAAPAKSKSKCCNCCHDGVQTIDKEKAKAVLVDTLDSKNHFATYRRLVGDKAPIDHRLIADQSQIGRRYIAKIPALFVVKPIAAPSETDLRLT